jgi:cyclase
MIPKRIIPVFLLKDGRLVKGTRFRRHVDVGDPTSQAMVFDAQGADEIVIVDISATARGRLIDSAVINDMISKCRLPIAAGGGIRTVADAKQCFKAGADKIVVNTQAVTNPGFVKKLARQFGSQSVVVSIDFRREGGAYVVMTHAGKRKHRIDPEELIRYLIAQGAGELLVTLIDTEGTLRGFDLEYLRFLRGIVRVPLIVSGGAGCYDDMVDLFSETGADACGIGKMLFLRDYDIVRIKSYLKGKDILMREA